MRIIDTKQTRRALAFDRLIPALKEMFITGCEVPRRHTHTLPLPDGGVGTVLIMPAWQAGAFLGIKTVNIYPGNGDRCLPGLYSTYILYDAQTGEPLAQIDGNEITSRRTAAASALAATYLAPTGARHLLVIGSGRVGSLLPEAYRAVLPIEKVTLWDRDDQAAATLAQRLSDHDIDAVATKNLADAVGQADIVTCATLATSPVVHGAWLCDESHLDLIGSFTPTMREADDTCFTSARIFIDTEEALEKSGELLEPMSRGVFSSDSIAGTLAGLVRGSVEGRGGYEGRTVFKSVGTALEDLAAAVLVLRAMSS